MELPLISPASNTFLKNWPAYNGFNCDAIDEYAGKCLTTHGLQTYTPQLSAVTTPTAIGTGNIVGYYYELFDQIFTWGEFRFGASGASAGTGAWMVTLPFPATNLLGFSTTIGAAPIVGNGYYWENSSGLARFPLTVHLRTSTLMMFGYYMGSTASRELGQNSPVPVDPLDGASWCARYQREE